MLPVLILNNSRKLEYIMIEKCFNLSQAQLLEMMCHVNYTVIYRQGRPNTDSTLLTTSPAHSAEEGVELALQEKQMVRIPVNIVDQWYLAVHCIHIPGHNSNDHLLTEAYLTIPTSRYIIELIQRNESLKEINIVVYTE
jgi:hypothetical protein